MLAPAAETSKKAKMVITSLPDPISQEVNVEGLVSPVDPSSEATK